MTAATADLPTDTPAAPAGQGRLVRWLMTPVEFAAALLAAGLVVLVLAGVIFRYALSMPLLWVDEVASLMFLWLGMLGAAIAMARNEHLRLTLAVNALSGRWRALAETLSLMVTGLVILVLLPPAVDYAVLESIITSPVLEIPKSARIAALVVGLALMFLLVVVRLWRTAAPRDLLVGAVVLAVLVGALFLIQPVLAGAGRVNVLLLLLAVLALCLLAGVPIAFCFGGATLCFLLFATTVPLSVMIGRMDEGMSASILLSVPIFVLLGCILDESGIGLAIVNFLSSLLGHVRAGMSYVLLGALYIVSGISGSKVSDMATVAPALFPEMKRRGGKPPEMVALLATGAIMADTVPPSIVLIVLGSVAGLSIAALFTSGFVIAFFLLVVLAIVARWKSRADLMAEVRRAPLAVVGKTLLIAAPALLLPFLIRSAVGGGVATATEVSAIAVAYALAVSPIYGGIRQARFWRQLVETASMSGTILLIMGTALAAAWALTQSGFAGQMARAMTDLPGGWISFMLVSILAYMLLGCLLEGLPALVLLSPLLFPIARSFGIDGIHYAMVVVVAMNIGLFLPPVGIGYYIACGIGRIAPDEGLRPVWHYLLALMLGLLVIAFVPALSIGYL